MMTAMQKLTNSRQDEIDRTQFGFMGQAVQNHELYFGRLQRSPDGLRVPERGRVFPANDPKCRRQRGCRRWTLRRDLSYVDGFLKELTRKRRAGAAGLRPIGRRPRVAVSRRWQRARQAGVP